MVEKSLRFFAGLVLLFSITFASIPTSVSQTLDSDQVKIAYIYNFIKHITWPESSSKTSFTIAIYDDDSFYNLADQALTGRKVNDKSIQVVSVSDTEQARTAHLVFVSSLHNSNIREIATGIRQSGTLFISDQSQNRHDIMINLVFDRESSAISFEVNKSNIVFEGLKMSTELLLLGGTELDVATLYRETELAMQDTRKRELELNKRIHGMQSQLDESAQQLGILNIALQRNNDEVKKKNKALTLLENNIKKQQVAFNDKERELLKVSDLLAKTERVLNDQHLAINKKEQENTEMAHRIAENKHILDQQKQELLNQENQLAKQREALGQQLAQIDSQKSTINIISILIVIAVFVSTLVVILFFKNRGTTKKLGQTLANLENTQDQLIQSEKMASLGTLTAGVAHEINTPLGIIVTAISLLTEKTQEIKRQFSEGKMRKSSMSKFFEAIEQSSDMSNKALERVLTLLGNFKQVAADQVVEEAREVNLADYIDEVINTLSAELKKHKVAYFYSGETDLKIVTIPGILAQIITNLVTNALNHAFEHTDNGQINIHVAITSERGAKIIFQDNGCGMSQDVIDQIYDPFFTTKRGHGGTGLGMNIVYNLINKKLEGSIYIDSLQGEGTTVTLSLPSHLDKLQVA